MSERSYHIFSHADTDGGISAAIISKFVTKHYPGWKTHVTSVNYQPQTGEWPPVDIQYPSAILDFSLHPKFLENRFYKRIPQLEEQLGGKDKIPPCLWLDHHPTGSGMSFLKEENVAQYLPQVKAIWDTTCVSTPSLIRKYAKELSIPNSLIDEYQLYIDIADIVDGALYTDAEAAHDFSSRVIQVQTLFSLTYPSLDRRRHYRKLVSEIQNDSDPNQLMSKDPLYLPLIHYEEMMLKEKIELYKKIAVLEDNVAYVDLSTIKSFRGIARFIPYLLFPKAEYCIHIFPSDGGNAHFNISCGINPWNKPKQHIHLGHYFAEHFAGGGHAVVAGGRVNADSLHHVGHLKNKLKS